MTTNFKIIGFDESSGVVIVRYSDNMPPVSVDVPLDGNGLYLTGDELIEHIRGFLPFEFLDRIDRIKQGVANAADVHSMVTAEQAPPVEEVNEENTIMWQKINTEKAFAALLVKWGVLSQDPTEIPVSSQ